MKTTKFILLSVAVLALSAFTAVTSTQWNIEKGYSIKFSGTDAEGIFKNLEGSVQFDSTNTEKSSFSFKIPVNSINTGNGMKNKHAVGKKWFDAKNFPFITFESSAVSSAGNDYNVAGTMNIHGVAKEMTIPFSFNGKEFSSKFSVNRMDFGVGKMKGMAKKVGNEIKLTVDIPVVKK